MLTNASMVSSVMILETVLLFLTSMAKSAEAFPDSASTSMVKTQFHEGGVWTDSRNGDLRVHYDDATRPLYDSHDHGQRANARRVRRGTQGYLVRSGKLFLVKLDFRAVR